MSMARQAIDRRLEEGTRLRNLPVYTEITGQIEELLQTKCNYTNVKCHLFGSRMLGVATDDSELDIFVDIRKMLRAHNFICLQHCIILCFPVQ